MNLLLNNIKKNPAIEKKWIENYKSIDETERKIKSKLDSQVKVTGIRLKI